MILHVCNFGNPPVSPLHCFASHSTLFQWKSLFSSQLSSAVLFESVRFLPCRCVGGVFSAPDASLSPVLSSHFNPKTCFLPPAPFCFLSTGEFLLHLSLSLRTITFLSPSPSPSLSPLLSQSSQPVIGRVYE